MVFENTKLLLRLLWQPAAAMSGILDRGSLLFASLAVLAVSLLFQSHGETARSAGARNGYTAGPGAGRSADTRCPYSATVVVQFLHAPSGSGGDLRSRNAARDQFGRPAWRVGNGLSARLLAAAHLHFDGMGGGADPGGAGGLGGAVSVLGVVAVLRISTLRC
jgi:hypothetical protein